MKQTVIERLRKALADHDAVYSDPDYTQGQSAKADAMVVAAAELAADEIDRLTRELAECKAALSGRTMSCANCERMAGENAGRKVVDALFPAVDPAIREALGRLVEVTAKADWLFVAISTNGGGIGLNGLRNNGDIYWAMFTDANMPPTFGAIGTANYTMADPAAVVAAIDATIGRVQDAK